MKNRLVTLMVLLLSLVSCDGIIGSDSGDYNVVMPDGSTINLLSDVYQEGSFSAKYKLDFEFELGFFPDLALAQRYQSKLSQQEAFALSAIWRREVFSYDSSIVPVIWFSYQDDDNVPCNFTGSFKLTQNNTDKIIWQTESVEVYKGIFPKNGWKASPQLIKLSIEEMKLEPTFYSLSVDLVSDQGLKIQLSKNLQILPKPTYEELRKLPSHIGEATAALQLYTTTSAQLMDLVREPISEERWAEILSKTLVTSINPGQPISAAIVVRSAGKDFYGKSSLVANYSLYNESGAALVRGRDLAVWTGDAIPDNNLQIAQQPFSIVLPAVSKGKYLFEVEVLDLVTMSTTRLASEIEIGQRRKNESSK